MNKVILKDTVTLDETLISYKENGFEVETTINKAGETKRKRGMSNNQINITYVMDSSNNIIVQVADRGCVTARTLKLGYLYLNAKIPKYPCKYLADTPCMP